jgi:antitoxin ParD1/3/4
MSGTTMSFSLPDTMREYIDNRVESGSYGNTSEYLRELIRHDQMEQSKKRFRELIEEGLRSGPGRVFTAEVESELRYKALGSAV